MFTGIISTIGTLINLENSEILKARILCSYDYKAIEEGTSIAHDGICLTIFNKLKEKEGVSYEVEVSTETQSRTNIRAKKSAWTIGKKINLERSLRLGDELGGHIVTGHVDGVAKLVRSENVDRSTKFTFEIPENFVKFVAPKGSIALNGTSLTVNEVSGSLLTVNVIPHTKKVTTWNHSKIGELFNMEIDLMARYIARLCKPEDKNENL